MRATRINRGGLAVALILVASLTSTVSADMVFNTGNNQYTNVNIQADQSAMTILANVDSDANNVITFRGADAGPSFVPIVLHGQHGVAFVEAFNPVDTIYRFTIRADSNHYITAADWKLDAAPPVDGTVSFLAYDSGGNLIPPVGGLNTFAISHNGQNPYGFTTTNGSLVRTLVIESTVPMLDIKQVSVNTAVPEPGSVALLGLGGCLLVARRFVRRRCQPA